MKNIVKFCILILVSSLIFCSCSKLMGYGVLLWSVPEYNLEDGERGLASYFGKDNISRNKVYSIKPDVEMVRDTMMGVVAIKMTKPLTQTEIDDLKDYVTGQFSDGWGESFEQHEIQVSGGQIYVHFWDSEEYYINTDEEMEQMLEQNMNEGMQGMQGMSGM